MSKYSIILLISIALIIVIGAYVWMSTGMDQGIAVTSYNSSSTNGKPQQTDQVIIMADDATATISSIPTTLGENVAITFNIEASGTSPSGLDFRSPVVSTGPIKPGDSKTVNFTAENSFTFSPFKPATDVRRAYNITVIVQ